MIRALGHAAVWTALYAGAVVVCTLQVGRIPIDARAWIAVLAAVLLGQGVYLLDRAKLSDALLDAGDEEAHPQRFAFVYRHRRTLRQLIVVEALAATALLGSLHPLLMLVVPASFVGVVVYAGLPRACRLPPGSRRIKDLLIVKNLAVSLSLTALGLSIAMALDPASATQDLVFVGLFVLLLVLGDSMLCDLDDRRADQLHGTHTLAWRASPTAVRLGALGIGVVLMLMALVLRPQPTVLAWSVMLLVSTIGLVLLPEGQIRDAVDLRLPIVACVALALFQSRAFAG